MGYRIGMKFTDLDGGVTEHVVHTCCNRSALAATWDEEGARLDEDEDVVKSVVWSEDALSGRGRAPDVCGDCLEPGEEPGDPGEPGETPEHQATAWAVLARLMAATAEGGEER